MESLNKNHEDYKNFSDVNNKVMEAKKYVFLNDSIENKEDVFNATFKEFSLPFPCIWIEVNQLGFLLEEIEPNHLKLVFAQIDSDGDVSIYATSTSKILFDKNGVFDKSFDMVIIDYPVHPPPVNVIECYQVQWSEVFKMLH